MGILQGLIQGLVLLTSALDTIVQVSEDVWMGRSEPLWVQSQ